MVISKDLEVSSLKLVEGVKVKRHAIQSRHVGGLKIEILESGLKRFVYLFKIGGSESELLLGSYPAQTLAKARGGHGKAARGMVQEQRDGHLGG
jgi:hypothetical protein